MLEFLIRHFNGELQLKTGMKTITIKHKPLYSSPPKIISVNNLCSSLYVVFILGEALLIDKFDLIVLKASPSIRYNSNHLYLSRYIYDEFNYKFQQFIKHVVTNTYN